MEAKGEPGKTRRQVAELLADGLNRAEIAKRLGISRPTVTYHAKRLGFGRDERFARHYDWAAIRRAYDAGLSVRECKARFGFSSQTWYDAIARGDVVPRPAEMPMRVLLVDGRRTQRGHLKSRLLKAGLKRAACETCGVSEWRGQPIELHLHHVNGRRLDNRLENLQLLCPNCHSQTPNYSGRNRRREAA